MNPLELLAPARDIASGMAAIRCGADAVYIGAPRFGARAAAGNRVEDIAHLIEFAHRYLARVYIALNTLLTDREIPEAVALLRDLYDRGADGAIIQEMGLLEADLPPIPLIASTQAHNADPEKVRFLEKVGFARAILARELSIAEIRAIREAAPEIGLECFVHGALCVSYSGQCYLSAALGGRSGNRGDCAQPCRKPYRLTDPRGREIARGHLLSLRDLNRSEHLEALWKAGVSSFKIEGRLKDRVYVANAVRCYRLALDAVLRRNGLDPDEREAIAVDFRPDLSKAFNRGYTDYLWPDPGPVGSIDTPKMLGEPIGKAVSTGPGGVSFDREVDLRAGDGLCFFDRRGRLRGARVQSVVGGRAVLRGAGGLESGAAVWRNRDHRWTEEVRTARMERRVRVAMRVGRGEGGLFLEIADRFGNAVRADLEGPAAPARKPEQARDAILRQLAKTGDSEFACDRLEIGVDPVPFVPVAALNRWRREALARLRALREERREKPCRPIAPNDFPFPEKRLGYEGNVINRWAERFYRRHGVQEIEPGAEAGTALRGRRVMTCRYCILREIGRCPVRGGLSDPAGPLFLENEKGDRLRLAFDCGACRMTVYLES